MDELCVYGQRAAALLIDGSIDFSFENVGVLDGRVRICWFVRKPLRVLDTNDSSYRTPPLPHTLMAPQDLPILLL